MRILPAVLIVALLLRPVDCLTAVCGGTLLFAWPIREGDVFLVSFTHSLNRSPVTDYIEYTGKGFIVRKSAFKTFGGGIPVLSDGIGTELIKTGDGYELTGIDKAMEYFFVLTQEYPDHHIILGKRSASLVGFAGSGASVKVAVKKMPYIAFLLYDKYSPSNGGSK